MLEEKMCFNGKFMGPDSGTHYFDKLEIEKIYQNESREFAIFFEKK